MGQTQSAKETRVLLVAVCLLNEKLPITRIPLGIAPTLERILADQEAREANKRTEQHQSTSSESIGSMATRNSNSE